MRYDIKFSGHAIILPSGEAIDAEWSDGALFDQVRDGLYALEISPNIIEQAAGHIISFGRNIIKPNAHITPVKSTIDNRLIQMVPIGEGRTAAAGQVSYIHSPRWRGHKRGIQIPDYAFTRLKAFADLAHKTTLILKIERGNLAPWMKTAWEEVNRGVKEVAGSNSNSRIVEDYFKAAKFWGEDDSGAANAWCASFTAFIMQQNGYQPPKNAYRAKAWMNFGRKAKIPTYGSICVKSRSGGGHVGFSVGRDFSGKKLYLLGGNQSDAVNVREYDISVFEGFYLPKNYISNRDWLPIYNGLSEAQGSES